MAFATLYRPFARTLLSRIKRLAFGPLVLLRPLLPLTPVSRVFGSDRGQPLDRYYIEKFLAQHRQLITGRCLEVGELRYVPRYGRGVTAADVLHVDGEGCPEATVIGDLSHSAELPHSQYDCFVCTQTFQYVYDFEAGLRGAAQLLRPGGVLLATFPTVSRKSVSDDQGWEEYWRFTSAGVRRACSRVFGADSVQVESFGNVLAGSAFLMGLAAHEIGRRKLDYRDPDYEVLVGVIARKPE